ncbi:hypothetical protein SCB49_07687 [unidentified eubacterium SCB49]|nr:hypothetical protein SCB49_07687 [unidentified eubacterium SCB49]
MEQQSQKPKFLVLGVLFLLPITVYLFFASGVNNFGKLPVVTENVMEISSFKDLQGESVQLEDRITVLGFFGDNLLENKAYAYNLAHKIYKKNHQFEEFQFVILLPESARNQALILKSKIEEIAPTTAWKFAFGTSEEITQVFNSLGTNLKLQNHNASPYVFIIDKDRNVRGRDDDDDAENGILYGFDSSIIAEINNKMSDDVKVLLAEYRDARKDKPKRKI